MTREVTLSNLKEALEEVSVLINKIETEDAGFDEAEFKSRLAHAYHHLNFAWNARYVPLSAYTSLSTEDFYRWRSFPREMWELWLPFEVPFNRQEDED